MGSRHGIFTKPNTLSVVQHWTPAFRHCQGDFRWSWPLRV